MVGFADGFHLASKAQLTRLLLFTRSPARINGAANTSPNRRTRPMIDTNSDAFHEAVRVLINQSRSTGDISLALSKAIEAYLAAMPKDEWRDIATAPKDRIIDAIVDGEVRLVAWREASYELLWGWCLADEGDTPDICTPTLWRPRPTPPETQA
jgi:hypothetical protein